MVLSSHSYEVWWHSAETHHDISELWPSSLQADEVSGTRISDLSSIIHGLGESQVSSLRHRRYFICMVFYVDKVIATKKPSKLDPKGRLSWSFLYLYGSKARSICFCGIGGQYEQKYHYTTYEGNTIHRIR